MITASRIFRRSSESGLTLLEVIISLAMIGLISSLALGGLRLGARTWDTVTVRAEATGRAQTVRAFLQRGLGQTMPLLQRDDSRDPALTFAGEADSLAFVAPLAAHFGLGGPQRLRLFIVETASATGKQLVMLRRPYVDGDAFHEDDSEIDEAHVLLENIAEARFSYRAAGEDGEAGWSDSWRGEGELPGAIRIRISFNNRDLGDWPDLVVNRRITAEPDCLIPVGTTRCRAR